MRLWRELQQYLTERFVNYMRNEVFICHRNGKLLPQLPALAQTQISAVMGHYRLCLCRYIEPLAKFRFHQDAFFLCKMYFSLLFFCTWNKYEGESNENRKHLFTFNLLNESGTQLYHFST
jgi:hypothetical protein